jgi:hypothetical protein
MGFGWDQKNIFTKYKISMNVGITNWNLNAFIQLKLYLMFLDLRVGLI